MMNRQCPVCCSETLSPVPGHDWSTYGQDFRLLRCDVCGCAFTAPLPDDIVLKQIYEAVFDYRWYRDHYDAKLRDCRIRVKEYGSLLGEHVLDFGGGIGYFSTAVAETGRKSVTYDPYLGSSAPQPFHWDTLVALHVLEHTNDLERTLAEIKLLLMPGGRLILAVPNFDSRGYRERDMAWVWAQPPLVHIFHFTAAGLIALLTRHGFHQITASFHERWDANICSDVRHVRRQRILDSLWGIQPLNRFAVYRRAVARLNAAVRFHDLKKATRLHMESDSRCSELQIIATFGVA